ncbi:MAG: lipopolysaccharide biosynthesis protein [Kiritimatiellae bacterium]|nr:lipopolysaccharide biosynthesis protein [Kiritimatiellia bacterium]
MAKSLKAKTVSGFLYKMMERVGALGVNFAVSVILARLLLPGEYGLVALSVVLISILDVFVTHGFGNSLIADKHSDDVDFSTCFYFGLALSWVVYVGVFFAAPACAVFFKDPLIVPVLRVLALRIPIAAVNSVQHAFVSKHMMFRKFFISTSIGTVLSGILAVAMAYRGWGVWALVAQYLGNVVCDTVCLWIIVGWRPIRAFSLRRLGKIYDYGWKILVVGLIDTVYGRLRSLVIAREFTPGDLAYYNNGNHFPRFSMSILEPTINSVLFPALSQCSDDQKTMRDITRRMIGLGTYLVFPVMIGLIAVAKPLVLVLLTEKWLPSVVFLQIGCLAYMLRPLQFINTCVIKASGRSGLLLKLDILKKGLGLLVLFGSVRYGVTGVALSAVAVNLFSTLVNIAPNRTILAYGYGAQFWDIAKSAFLALAMGAGMFALSFVRLPPLAVLCLQCAFGAAFYAAGSVATRNEHFAYALDMLRNRMKRKQP